MKCALPLWQNLSRLMRPSRQIGDRPDSKPACFHKIHEGKKERRINRAKEFSSFGDAILNAD
jgi:hypothetical protein